MYPSPADLSQAFMFIGSNLEQAIADTQAAVFCYKPVSLFLAGTRSSLLCYSLSYLFAVRMEL